MAGVRATEEQKLFLLDYMEQHILFSQGEFKCGLGREEHRREWQRLTDALNNLPHGANKTATKWNEYWGDQREGVKKRAQIVSLHNQGTGGGPPTEGLSEYDRRVLTCMGGWKRVVGISAVKDSMDVEGAILATSSRSRAHSHQGHKYSSTRSPSHSRSRAHSHQGHKYSSTRSPSHSRSRAHSHQGHKHSSTRSPSHSRSRAHSHQGHKYSSTRRSQSRSHKS